MSQIMNFVTAPYQSITLEEKYFLKAIEKMRKKGFYVHNIINYYNSIMLTRYRRDLDESCVP